MSQQIQVIKPRRLVIDAGRKYLPADAAFYALNHNTRNKNALDKGTPMAANYPACQIDKPNNSESYRIGGDYFPVTNEEYAFIFNSNNIHWISRLNGDGVCEIVDYNREGAMCYDFSSAPKYEIKAQSRVDLIVEKSNCTNRHGKYLIWCDGLNEDIGFLDVDAAIATDGFTTPFFDQCNNDPCDFRRLCVPQPCYPLTAEWEPLPDEQIGWTNNMVDVAIKLMFKWEYYDGRMTEWSDRGISYFQNAKGCFDAAGNSLPRCLRVRVPVGNSMVTRIHIAYNKAEFDETTNDEIWYKAEVVEKYKKYSSSQQYWYERKLAELLNYSDEDCSFDYLFCNDKQCDIIDPKEISRVYNPMPRSPQGFVTIKEAKAFYNYVTGNCPIAPGEVEKFKITATYNDAVDCKFETVDVIVRAIIYNDVYQRGQFIYRLGGEADADDDVTDTAFFGGLSTDAPDYDLDLGFGQQFKGETRNFIAYVEGLETYAEMIQWRSGANFTNRTKSKVKSGLDIRSVRHGYVTDADNGNFYYQEAIIKVKKGTRGFIRLKSHSSTGAGNQDTSTSVTGLIDIRDYTGTTHISFVNLNEEIYFDTCDAVDGKVELTTCFVIDDNAVKDTVAFSGYVKDDNGRAVEWAEIHVLDDGDEDLGTVRTDFNGFYHAHLAGITGDSVDLSVRVERDCAAFTEIERITVVGVEGQMVTKDIDIEDKEWTDRFYTNVKSKVVDCNGTGIAGIRVALSGSKYKVTDAAGIATFRIRNYPTRDRVATAIVMDHKGCFIIGCTNECNQCMPSSSSPTLACYNNMTPVTLTLSDMMLSVVSALQNSSGLKAGGLYKPAILLEGTCGSRISAAYELPELRILRTQDKGNYSFPSLSYDATGIRFPFDGCLKILFSENLNDFQLQWIVDKIDRTSDNKIKLTIQSLNDYNFKYFFKTNTSYQWLKGDRVEFIKNGDGEIFTIAKNGLLNYLAISPFHDELISGEENAPADFFNQLLIEDDGKLEDLKIGAIIELQRTKTCTTEPTFFARGISLPVVNGLLLNPTGTFIVTDTYFVNRVITYQDDDRDVVTPAETFEHHSPSDFWGDHISDIGKGYFTNKFENEKRFEKKLSVGSPTQFNYFGDIVKEFDVKSGIVSMNIKDSKVILAVLETDTFIAQTSDELVRVSGDGIIIALPPDSIVSDAQPKIRGEYGCRYEDIGSIYYGDGYAFFANSKSGNYIIHDYSEARICGLYKDESGRIVTSVKSYTSKRFQEMSFLNGNETNYLKHYKFIVGYNSEEKTLYTTIKRLRDAAVNNSMAPYIKKNETLIYDPETDEFLTFHSATPEGYSYINLNDANGSAMIVYFNAIPYIVPVLPDSYNEFFGVACDWLIGITLNKDKDTVKVPIAIETQSDKMFFVPKDGVHTETNNFTSEIPPVRVKLDESKYHAGFLNNVNSRGGLYNGSPARDYSVSVLLCRDNTDALKYLSINRNKMVEYGELDFITIKFIASLPMLQEN